MGNEFIMTAINELREGESRGLNATELGKIAKATLGPAFGPVSFVAVFRGAFGIPLDVLQRAHAWQGFNFGGNMISDKEFEDLLSEWLPGSHP
ncbi:hypothetical protein HRW14_24590 [Streptomyces lunaelactis]|uniref:hypothetical protein n=1 Tax=Streptomyces lunaelactis TaxID=1535768 RepID=UPI001585A61C|nr:hypothetical protein [Streptomyces lunaelactis]NUK53394.1 hypothetical protein [Streptomyces lunaelactis]NUK67081.1 hypothetical protein [Streptomyces lunaelactis]